MINISFAIAKHYCSVVTIFHMNDGTIRNQRTGYMFHCFFNSFLRGSWEETRQIPCILTTTTQAYINSIKHLMRRPLFLKNYLWVHFFKHSRRLHIMYHLLIMPPGVFSNMICIKFWNTVLISQQMLNWSVAKKNCKNDAYAYCEYENIKKLFLLYHIVLLL